MDILPFLAMLIVLSIPFWVLGRWLVRNSRSMGDLAKTLDEHAVDLGQFRVRRRASAWWLFADVRFVVFLVLGRYRRMELPPAVRQALESGRADYLRGLGVFTTIVLVGFVAAILGSASASAQADDAARCIELVVAGRLDSAESICLNLEIDDPAAAMAFAYYQYYGVVGPARVARLGVTGIEEATTEEKRALESARRYFLVAAEAGSPGAQYLLALTILTWDPPERTDEGVRYSDEATYWLIKAAEQDVPDANYLLGIRALSPGGTWLTEPEYLPYLKRAAELGHEEAAERLGEYERAIGLAENPSLEDAAALRQHAAGLWMTRDADAVREANRLMRWLADAGDETAMLVAAKWAWPDDVAEARRYLDMAVAAGNDEAMIALGNLFACNRNADKARLWFENALERNHPEARAALDELAEWGIEGWDCRYL